MLHYFFANFGETAPFGQYGYITVHFTVNLYVFNHFMVVGFESTIEIVQLDIANFAGGPVEELGGKRFGNGIVTLFLPAAHHMITVA